ncbi:homoserine O-acetyltransferase [Gordonia desulfuricans]|uniref:Homoserine O-acetyltransferase n=1 Tax=Gordonia desulfuricans TaxID=89051 RepID=A0A7K3LUU4_9ACTN|nr:MULTISPECIES: homoserine O-acetyltransferase [Gordonia]KOY49418.1 homoserine acetyltransferase [Gordonia sp. NB41Y]NDK91969.1 homoserine O-acetyltransferase [Gordonia desulfuricans]WLP91559.1 homoserine O-acetyltransferase [Gordonia sp. NB41Y]
MSVTIDPKASQARQPDWEKVPDGRMVGVRLGPMVLDSGYRLDDVTLAFQRWGTLSPSRDNVILALHALTGDSHVTGEADAEHPSPGWWDGLIGPGCAVDTDEWCVISANVLGGCRGSTGPASLDADGRPWGSRFPEITVLDQVRAEAALLEALDIRSIGAVVGGSMGGARALEWAVEFPDRVRSALVLAVGARATADQIGTQTTQIAAITSDPDWQGGDYHGTGRAPFAGMGIARRIAHLTYRHEVELDERFANHPQGQENPLTGGRYAVQSYLEHQAEKLTERFDPGSYVVLSNVLNHHDVGRGRGGVAAALRSCTVPVIVAGIDSDRLYPLRLQAEIADLLGNCVGGLQVVNSDKGHDGFLTEFDAVADLLKRTVDLARN